jgi:hypothetical protein
VESRGVEPRRRACKAQLQPAGVPLVQETGDREQGTEGWI